MLGEGYNPALGILDFSTINEANRSRASANANFARELGGIAEDALQSYDDRKKKQKADLAKSEAAAKLLDSAMKLNPAAAPALAEYKARLEDRERPLSESVAMADQISELLGMVKDERLLAMEDRKLNNSEDEFAMLYNQRNNEFSQNFDQRQDEFNRSFEADAAASRAGKSYPKQLQSTDITLQDGRKAKAAVVFDPGSGDVSFPDFSGNESGVNVDGEQGVLPPINGYPETQLDQNGNPILPDGLNQDSVPIQAPGAAYSPIIIDSPTEEDRLKTENLRLEKQRREQEIAANQKAADVGQKAEIDKKAAIIDAARAELDAISRLENSKGLDASVGVIDSLFPTVLESTKDAELLMEQIKNQGVFKAIRDLKMVGASLGQISNEESKRLETAYSGLTAKGSDGLTRKNLQILKDRIISAAKIAGATDEELGIAGAQAQPEKTPEQIMAETRERLRQNKLR